jgi:spermidine synthase
VQRKNKLFLIFILFLGSGSVGLIYEIVWARQLQHFFGSTTFSVSAILTSFFSGMALGSYLLGKWGNKYHPIRLYAILEFSIGIYAISSPLLLNIIDRIYGIIGPALANNFMTGQLIKLLMSFVILIIPCTLMGGTLPVLSRYVKTNSGSTSGIIGRLYAVNTLGAVLGAGLTGFLLIEKFGLSNTVLIGGCINILIGGIALVFSLLIKSDPFYIKSKELSEKKYTSKQYLLPVIIYGISGFCALGYEVLWTRGLIQTITSSTYAFSVVLLLFLSGISLGSFVVSSFVKRIKKPVVWFAFIQILLGFSVILSILNIVYLQEIYQALLQTFLKFKWLGRLIASGLSTAFLLLIPTLLMGSLFPIVISWANSFKTEIGYTVGRIYCANTIGSILGSFSAGFVMLSLIGLRNSLFVMALINFGLGLYLLWKKYANYLFKIPFISTMIVIIVFIVSFSYLPESIYKAENSQDFRQLFYKEGPVANVAVYQCIAPGRDFKMLKTNGIYLSGGTDKHAMMVQRRQGHLPMLLHDQPDSVLVIGLATGITLSAVVEHAIKSVECIEIVPSQLKALSFFTDENNNVINNPNIKIIIDDGRSYVQNIKKKYNVIIGDLFQVGSAGTGDLYSVEHVRACKNILTSDGIMVQWLPLQQLSEMSFKSVLKSYTEVFPFVQLWFCDTSPDKPIMAVVASTVSIRLDVDRMNGRIKNSHAVTLPDVGFNNPYLVISQCIMQTEMVKEYIGNVTSNTYNKPVIEFLSLRINKQETSLRIINSLLKIKSPLRFQAEGDIASEKMVNYIRAHYQNLLAQLAGFKNKWKKAEVLLQNTLEIAPENFDTRRILAKSKVVLSADLIYQGRPQSALTKLDSARTLGEDDVYMFELIKAAQNMVKSENFQSLQE